MADTEKFGGDTISGSAAAGTIGGERFDGGAYTAGDRAEFEKLAQMLCSNPHYGAGSDTPTANWVTADLPSAFDYSNADDQAFDRLMDQLKGYRSRRPSAKPGRASFGTHEYTEQDDRIRCIVIPDIVMHFLKVPTVFTGIGVKCHN